MSAVREELMARAQVYVFGGRQSRTLDAEPSRRQHASDQA